MKTFNVGIIGAGTIINAHLAVLSNMQDISIKWVGDINKTNLLKIKKAYKINTIELNNENVDLSNIDIILILIPYGVRQKYYELLRGTSIALYVEKPFAKTEKEHLFTCSGFKPYKLAVGFQRRALGKTAIIKKIIKEGFFGKLKRISFEFGNTRASRGLSYQNNPALSGGGILFDVAIHGIDCIMFFTQAEKLVLKSKKIIYDKDLNIDIHSEIEFELFDPLGSSIQCNSLISQLTNTSNNINLKFENADLVFSIFDDEPIKILKNGLSINLTDAVSGNMPSTSHQIFYSFWRTFIEGIVCEETNLTSAINSVMTTRFIEQSYQ